MLISRSGNNVSGIPSLHQELTFSPLCHYLFIGGITRTISIQDEYYLSVFLYSPEITQDYTHSVVIDEYNLPRKFKLSSTAKRSLAVTNAGGKSDISEAISMDYFEKIFKAKDIILEMEVEYWIEYSMVDYICTVEIPNNSQKNHRIGVSVTRAMGYPDESIFTQKDASYLLKKKLYGLIVSRNAVTDKHSFFRSVLHVWCQSRRIAEMLKQEFQTYDFNDFGLDVQGSIILLLTVCPFEGIYNNSREGLILT